MHGRRTLGGRTLTLSHGPPLSDFIVCCGWDCLLAMVVVLQLVAYSSTVTLPVMNGQDRDSSLSPFMRQANTETWIPLPSVHHRHWHRHWHQHWHTVCSPCLKCRMYCTLVFQIVSQSDCTRICTSRFRGHMYRYAPELSQLSLAAEVCRFSHALRGLCVEEWSHSQPWHTCRTHAGSYSHVDWWVVTSQRGDLSRHLKFGHGTSIFGQVSRWWSSPDVSPSPGKVDTCTDVLGRWSLSNLAISLSRSCTR